MAIITPEEVSPQCVLCIIPFIYISSLNDNALKMMPIKDKSKSWTTNHTNSGGNVAKVLK